MLLVVVVQRHFVNFSLPSPVGHPALLRLGQVCCSLVKTYPHAHHGRTRVLQGGPRHTVAQCCVASSDDRASCEHSIAQPGTTPTTGCLSPWQRPQIVKRPHSLVHNRKGARILCRTFSVREGHDWEGPLGCSYESEVAGFGHVETVKARAPAPGCSNYGSKLAVHQCTTFCF